MPGGWQEGSFAALNVETVWTGYPTITKDDVPSHFFCRMSIPICTFKRAKTFMPCKCRGRLKSALKNSIGKGLPPVETNDEFAVYRS